MTGELTEPPAFIKLHIPATLEYPAADRYLPCIPCEEGPAFHARATRSAKKLAQERGSIDHAPLRVTFMDALPLLWQRRQQANRYLWRWWMEHEGSDVDLKLWCAGKLLQLRGIDSGLGKGGSPWAKRA